MTKVATAPEDVTLPTWTDAASVTSYLTSIAATICALIGLTHPGFHEPADIQSAIPAVGLTVAGVAQLVNIWTHRAAQAAAIAANSAMNSVLAGRGHFG